MKTQTIGLLVIAACLIGCVPSLHELYTSDTLVYDPTLVGTWEVDKTAWHFDGDPNSKSYKILITEKTDSETKESPLVGHLVDLKGKRYLDLYPDEKVKLNTGDWFTFHLLPVHTFLVLNKKDGQFTLAVMNPDTIKDIVTKTPKCIKHETIQEGRVVLTASPKELQAFIAKNTDVKEFFGDPVEMKPTGGEPVKK
jgi:hypothetical protein